MAAAAALGRHEAKAAQADTGHMTPSPAEAVERLPTRKEEEEREGGGGAFGNVFRSQLLLIRRGH